MRKFPIRSLDRKTHDIPIGETVFSKTVGAKPEFWGIVTHHGIGSHGPYYHVRDFADGTEWHRGKSEIVTQEAHALLVAA